MTKTGNIEEKFEWVCGNMQQILMFIKFEVLANYPSVCVHKVNGNTKLLQF